MENSTNLWPKFEISKIRTPKSILEEQASFLGERTKNLIKAEVRPANTNSSDLKFFFRISVPALDYKMNILSITHPVTLYPIQVHSNIHNWHKSVNNEKDFFEVLADILSNEKLKKDIENLLAHSLANTAPTE